MDIDKYNELIERGYDPGLLGPPPDAKSDTATSEGIDPDGEKKGWVAQNPYRAAFVALSIVVVGGVVGLLLSLGGSPDAETGPSSSGETSETAEQADPLPAVGELVPYPKNNPQNAYWEVGVDLAPGVYERDGEGWCWWQVYGPTEDEVLSKSSTAEDTGIALVPEEAVTMLTSGCGQWVRVG